jgi:hypothetical protein
VPADRLHPVLTIWLGRLDLLPPVTLERVGLVPLAGRAVGRTYGRVLTGLLFLVWLGFVLQVYVGEFVLRHPGTGFLNRPLIQVPCFNYVPQQLADEAK